MIKNIYFHHIKVSFFPNNDITYKNLAFLWNATEQNLQMNQTFPSHKKKKNNFKLRIQKL